MSHYYWYEGKKIELEPSATRKAVRFGEMPSETTRQGIATAMGNQSTQSPGIDLGNGIVLFEINGSSPEAATAASSLPSGASALSVFESSGTPMVVTEEFNVQFKPEITQNQIDQFNKQNNVVIASKSEWEKNAFILSVQKEAGVDAMDMANRYYESGLVLYAQPNFIRLMKPLFTPNDPLFPQQWALQNTGQGGGTTGQDIKAVNAWDITRGSQAITIAVIDEGVDYTHPDFNIPNKLVTGYDAVRRINDPAPNNNDAHGTACAGIACAASGNGTGISGVAPNCRLMGIRIAYGAGGGWVTTDAQIADGINTAVARGADILSNSWGGGSPSTAITNAIRNAKNNGRGGRGCVVCFAAGNNDGPVSYPGNLPEVITVAACNEWGERKSRTSRDGENWWGSNFGVEIDVSAPGVHITTTDIRGARGYSGNDYTNTFNGTSAATPHVAGVAALILSLNPNLRANEVENLLRSSTDDLEQPGYDVLTGFGRINALKALKNTQKKSFTAPIIAVHSNLALDVSGVSTAQGAQVIQWPWHGGANQLFTAEPLDDGSYRLIAKHSGLVLDVYGFSKDPGARIIQWTWHGGDNQRFWLERQTDSTYRIISKHSGLALDIRGVSTSNGAELIQWPWHGGKNQRFKMLSQGVSIQAVHSNLVLDIYGASLDPGAKLIQWNMHGGGNQRFRFDALGDGSYRIFAEHSNLVLDVFGASTAAGAKVIQWFWHGGNNQRFKVEPLGDGTFRIIAIHSGLALDVYGFSSENGAEIIQWPWHGGNNQRFRFI